MIIFVRVRFNLRRCGVDLSFVLRYHGDWSNGSLLGLRPRPEGTSVNLIHQPFSFIVLRGYKH